ncbi:MAG: VCBS repeat-containing protein [Polyangiaceae bacterium]
MTSNAPPSSARIRRGSLRKARSRAPLLGGPLALLLAALTSCADLQIIPEDQCGNGVVEPEVDEDCDDGAPDCGAVGTVSACRLLCDRKAGIECREGSGMGCGTDGICRKPSGELEILSAASTSTGLDLFAGDVNNDGCHELFLTGRRGVALTAFESFAPGDCPASSQEVLSGRAPEKNLVRPPPVLADMNRDSRADLVRIGAGQYGDAMFVDLGSPAPEVAAAFYASVRVGESAVTPLRVTFEGSDALLLFLDNPMGMGGIGLASVTDPLKKPNPAGGITPGGGKQLRDLSFLVAVDLGPVDVVVGPDTKTCDACDELLLGFAGDSVIQRFALYKGTGTSPPGAPPAAEGPMLAPPVAAITLPPGRTLREKNASIAVIDYDGDSTLDVIVNTEGGPLHIAYGAGDGRFHSTSPPDTASPDGKASPLPMGSGGQDLFADPNSLFVAADFDDVAPGIELVPILCPPAPPLESITCNSIERHGCEAVVLDVDADGYLDIVTTEDQQPGLTLLRHAASGGFHESFLDTSCPPQHLATGDFDDDGVQDLAFFDQMLPGGEVVTSDAPVDTLMVAYGNAYALPGAPVPSGRFNQAQGLTVGKFSPDSTVSEIYAARSLTEALKSGFALIEGYGERQLFAPYYLPNNDGMMVENQLLVLEMAAATSGRFSFDADGNPVTAVAMITREKPPGTSAGSPGAPGTETLWLLDGRDNGSSIISLAVAGDDNPSVCEHCVLTPIDTPSCSIAGNPDDLLVLGDGQILLYSVQIDDEAEGGAAQRFELCATFPTEHSFSYVDPEPKPEKYVPRPLVADLDGDGFQDVLARADSGAMIVLWGQPGGGFDIKTLIPATECQSKCSVALLDLDGDPENGKELFVAAPGSLTVHGIQSRALTDLPTPTVLTSPTLIPPKGTGDLDQGTDYTAAAAGDLDGDGIDDLALMPSSGIVIALRGVPVQQ